MKRGVEEEDGCPHPAASLLFSLSLLCMLKPSPLIYLSSIKPRDTEHPGDCVTVQDAQRSFLYLYLYRAWRTSCVSLRSHFNINVLYNIRGYNPLTL